MEVSPFGSYYFYIVAKQHPVTATAFTLSLPDSLKADPAFSIDLTDMPSVSTSSKKGCPPKDEYFNQLAVSAMKFFDEASKEAMGPNTKINEYAFSIIWGPYSK